MYKVQVEYCSSQSNSEINLKLEKRYIILTDINIIIFSPDNSSKNKAKIIFVGQLKEITSIKETKIFTIDNQSRSTGLVIEWTNTENVARFKNVIILDSDKTNSLIDAVNTRIKKLRDSMFLYQIEYFRMRNSIKKNELEIENLTKLIEHREKLFNEGDAKNEINLKELIILYQYLIEIHSAQNDNKCDVYINKLQNLFKNSKNNRTSDDDFFLLP